MSMENIRRLEDFLLLVIDRVWHLAGWDSMSQLSSQSVSRWRSSCSWGWLWPLEIVLYTAVSSAKSHANADNFSDISLIKAKRRHGPNTDPRGTPDMTFMKWEEAPLTTTAWRLLFRKLAIQVFVVPCTPYR